MGTPCLIMPSLLLLMQPPPRIERFLKTFLSEKRKYWLSNGTQKAIASRPSAFLLSLEKELSLK